jgi:hypothetical protein
MRQVMLGHLHVTFPFAPLKKKKRAAREREKRNKKVVPVLN